MNTLPLFDTSQGRQGKLEEMRSVCSQAAKKGNRQLIQTNPTTANESGENVTSNETLGGQTDHCDAPQHLLYVGWMPKCCENIRL
jgi:hypothetical protein